MITKRQITVYDLKCDQERCTTSESALPSLERAEEFLPSKRTPIGGLRTTSTKPRPLWKRALGVRP